jgi:hypothetical protein
MTHNKTYFWIIVLVMSFFLPCKDFSAPSSIFVQDMYVNYCASLKDRNLPKWKMAQMAICSCCHMPKEMGDRRGGVVPMLKMSSFQDKDDDGALLSHRRLRLLLAQLSQPARFYCYTPQVAHYAVRGEIRGAYMARDAAVFAEAGGFAAANDQLLPAEVHVPDCKAPQAA